MKLHAALYPRMSVLSVVFLLAITFAAVNILFSPMANAAIKRDVSPSSRSSVANVPQSLGNQPTTGLSSQDASTGGYYVPVTPARIADTRAGSGEPYGGQSLAPGATLNVQVAGVGGVPNGIAIAVVLNVTETGDTSATVIRVYPAGGSLPNASTLNPAAGATVNNQTTVKLGTNGQISVYNASGSTGAADIIIDVEGYYAAHGAGFVGISPVRISDTRLGSGQPDAGATMGPGSILPLLVAGNDGIPSNAVAAVMDITVVNATTDGYLTVYPRSALRPSSSTMNFTSGANLTKEATVGLSTGSAPGGITVYNHTGNVDVIIDVVGYYLVNSGNVYSAIIPTRIADTRNGSGEPYAGQAIPAGGTLTIQATGTAGIPAGATAVVVNLTVPDSTVNNTYQTAYPAGTGLPTATSVYYTGTVAFNEATITLSAGGAFTVFNHSGSTDIVVDVLGYDTNTSTQPTAGVCQRQPQDAVALMCADGSQAMYGYFITFIYPSTTFSGPPASGNGDLYDETNMITDTNLSGGIGVGLDVHYDGSTTQYRPYWIDYTNHGSYNYIGSFPNQSDGKNHSFMVLPHCRGCNTWDVLYDFNPVGTTAAQPANDSFHITTGWDLVGISGYAGFSQTQNRIQFLDGNTVFEQFDPSIISTLSPDGDCSPGSNPAGCFHFNTNISTITNGSTTTISSWDVSKAIITPSTSAAQMTPPSRVANEPHSQDDLVAMAQRIATERLHGRK